MARNNKHLAHMQQNPWVVLLVGCVCAGITFASFVWATDSGRIIAYVLFFTAAYHGIRCFIHSGTQIIKKQ